METESATEVKSKIYCPNMDGLRFIICMGIAVFHLGPYFFEGPYNFILKCDYFTDVFFILSGYLLIRSNISTLWTLKNYSTFLKKRLIRLYPLYFAALCFFTLIAILTHTNVVTPDNPARYDLTLLPYHILLVQSWGFIDSLTFNYVTWAISALLLMYILFPVFAVAAKKYPSIFIIAVAVFLIAIEYFCAKTGDLSITQIQKEKIGFVRAIPSFMFGIWLAHTDSFKMSSKIAIILFWGITLALFIWPDYLSNALRYGFIYPAIFFLVIADNQGTQTFLSWGVFKTLAPYSYGVFVLHTIIATVFLAFLMPRLMNLTEIMNSSYGLIFSVLGLAISLGLSLLAGVIGYHMIEKPSTKFLEKYI